MTPAGRPQIAGLVEDLRGLLAGSGQHRSESVRVGVDVVSIAWFARVLETSAGKAMAEAAFTPAERRYCAGRPDRYAVRWAAKEAVAKAIGTGFRGIRPGEIEVLHRLDGRPELAPAPGSTWPHLAHRWRWSLSLCHENDAALAFAVAITGNDQDDSVSNEPTERSSHGPAQTQ